jgi:hypothetical protein
MAKTPITSQRRPTGPGPSQKIVRMSSEWNQPGQGDPQEQAESDPVAPGDGQPKKPKAVALDSVDLDKLSSEFSSEIEFQLSAQEAFFQDLLKWSKIYRGNPLQQTKNYPLEHASNIVVKLAKIYCDQVIARIYQGITSTEPRWTVRELNRKAAQVCQPYEQFLDWNQKNMWNEDAFLLPYIQDCVKLGTAIGFDDFVNEPVVRYNDQLQQTEIVGNRKGPRPTWVPREDFIIPVGFSDLQVAPWIAHRCWYSWDLLEQMSYRGYVQDIDKLVGNSDEEDEFKIERRTHQEQVITPQPDSRFGLWAPWWVWFRRDLDKDGWPEQYVMLLHVKTRTILRLVANPSPSSTRPYFKSSFISVQGEFDGIGIPEDVEGLQEECSTIHNQRRDRSHLGNIVMYIAKLAGQLPDTIRPKSGLVIRMPGGADDIREFSPSIGQVPIDMAEEDSVMRLAAMTVGMNDVDLGKISSPVGRAAATSIMALMQEGARRFDLNVTQIRAALTEQAHQITELWQVYGLPDPDETGSPEQVLDPDDATLVRALLEQPASLRGLINIQLNASTAAVNREVEKQSNMQLLGAVQQHGQTVTQQASLIANPAVPMPIKAILLKTIEGSETVLKKLFQSFDAFDLESVLVGDLVAEIFQQSVQQQQMMQQMGIDPQAMAAQQQAQQGPQKGQPKPGNGQAPPQPTGEPGQPLGPPQPPGGVQ